MLKRVVTYFVIVLVATACYKYDKPKKPKNLIPKDKMVDIIMDIRLLSSANGKNKTTLTKNNLQAETYIYNKYNIDSLQFAQSNSYYAYYVDEYKAIYDKVSDSLESLKNKFDDVLLKEDAKKKRNDSINDIIKKDSINILKLKERLSLLAKKDSIKPLVKKDSIRLVKIKDSLSQLIKKDSVTRLDLAQKPKKTLITLVSDIDIQHW